METNLEAEESIKRIEIGSHHIVMIDKVFGPLVMCELRISIDVNRGEFIIERAVTPKDGEQSWEICARIDGQNSIEFTD